ncbi:MAG: alpha/beta fold hydrolase [Paracoccaceae bacterium]
MRAQAGFTPFVSTLGQGGRDVLALHCTMAFSGAWSGMLKAYDGSLTLHAPDMPSHGRSADWDGRSSFADTVYQASLSCLDKPMDIIGHSFGGAVALRLGLERPDLVRSLTLFEPVFFHVAALDDPAAMEDHDVQAAPFFAAMQTGDREQGARAFNRMWSEGKSRWLDMAQPLRDAMVRAVHVVPDTTGFLYKDNAGMLARLQSLQVPTLLMHGAQSLSVAKATNAGLARRISGARNVEVAGAGHMAPITHPRAVANIWRGFLQDLSPIDSD